MTGNAGAGAAAGAGRIAQTAGPLLPAADVAAAAGAFLRGSPPATRWDVDHSFDWAAADAARLTEAERSAVEFITIIEDHLPGYFAVYAENFPTDDSVDLDTFAHNRELYHFTVRWAQEEDTHARVLARYQLETGMAEAGPLRAGLAAEGRKRFELPYGQAVQFFTYPLVQEKATQIYYQHLRQVVGDPLLAEVLARLSRDEARHFTFFADMLRLYLVRYGDAVVEPIREVIADFRMPLADTVRGYWRWALRVAGTARYDHTEAYEHLVKVVNRAVDARSDKVEELIAFVTACAGAKPGGAA